ncbi:MAG: flagellar biosynthesis protein FlhF [Thiotrichales bacterium]
MKIRRFFAADTRKALLMVRRELGSEAIIMSNRPTADGVEIIAALDEADELREKGELEADLGDLLQQRDANMNTARPASADPWATQAAPARDSASIYPNGGGTEPRGYSIPQPPAQNPAAQPWSFAARARNGAAPDSPYRFNEPAPDASKQPPPRETLFGANRAGGAAPDMPPQSTAQPAPHAKPAAPSVARNGSDPDASINSVRNEINQLRGLLESQFNTLQTREWAAFSPNRTKLLRHLTRLGLNRGLASQVISALPNVDAQDVRSATKQALELLVRHIPVGEDEILRDGGQIVLLGPAGAGKTTTIAKLTAQFLQRYTARDIMYVSTDYKRIGAHEQLLTFARLFNVPILWAKRPEEIQQILSLTTDKRLVLVDTPSMNTEDIANPRRLATLWMDLPKLRNYLVLPTHMQPYTLDRVVAAFTGTPMKSCILTKVDEANTLGGALSAVIRHRVPVSYWCDGPRITEDLHVATPQHLVAKAVALAKLHDPESVERAQGNFLPRADELAFPQKSLPQQ